MFDLIAPVRALAVALGGVGLAKLWFDGQLVAAVGLAAGMVIAGIALDWIGKRLLPNQPTMALRFLEWWILTPAAIAAVASAIVVVVTVTATLPEGSKLDQSTKTLIATLSTGLTAFVAAAFISWAADGKDSKLADHIRSTFQSRYRRGSGTPPAGVHFFAPELPGERWVYSDEYKGIEGWGSDARVKRAEGIAQALRAPR